MKNRMTLLVALWLPITVISQQSTVRRPTLELQSIRNYVIGKKFEFSDEIPDAEDADRQFFAAKDRLWTGKSVVIGADSVVYARLENESGSINMSCVVIDHSNDAVNFDQYNEANRFPSYLSSRNSEYLPFIRQMPFRLRGQNEFNQQPHEEPSKLATFDYLIPYAHVLSERKKQRERNEQTNLKRYGKYWAYMKQDKVVEGMSEEACAVVLGNPEKSLKSVSGEHLIEIWEYGGLHYGYSKLFFRDDILYKVIKSY